MKKLRVLIVEDSAVVRELLSHIISSDPRLMVAEAVESGEEALRVLARVAPDVISMDIRLPGMNGFEATRRIMSERPTPIVVISASVESDELQITMNALRAGALTVVEKPVGTSHRDYEAIAAQICTQLVIMSEVKLVGQRYGRSAAHPPLPRSARASPAVPRPPGSLRMIGIVSSTGGPAALSQLLGELDVALPILLVQHMNASFLQGFADWLGNVCPQKIAFARDGEVPRPGTVYLPPADRHLRLEGSCLRLDSGPPVSASRPSGTVLFKSMAQSLGDRALGVLLTGMGNDGAAGLLELRRAGGHTLAESEATAVVYGMPAAAVELGAVLESLPLDAMAARIQELVSG